MAFPTANAVNIQGVTILVGYLFGPASVVIFNTYRTISRVLVQVIALLGRSLWPEISRQFGAGNFSAVVSIYKYGILGSVMISLATSLPVYFLAPYILEEWTSGHVLFDGFLLKVFLLSTVLTSFWQMSMIVLSATNQHSAFSLTYLFSALVGVLVTYGFSDIFGFNSPLIGMILFELLVILSSGYYVNDLIFKNGRCV
jgi:O-antigen/teichoic acid export membrane protein